VWPNSSALARSAPSDFAIALQVLADTANLLMDPQAVPDATKEAVVLVLVSQNP
jgi:hypothetical protein